jgi:hypothetical protein
LAPRGPVAAPCRGSSPPRARAELSYAGGRCGLTCAILLLTDEITPPLSMFIHDTPIASQ